MSPEVQRRSNITCFRCHKSGHYACQCPTKALHIGELEENESEPITKPEEEVYEANPSLVEEYEEDELIEILVKETPKSKETSMNWVQ